jgi:hypothetical protein
VLLYRDSNRITREAVQNPVHSVAVSGPQERSPENEPAVSPAIANDTAVLSGLKVPPRGVEKTRFNAGETYSEGPSDVKSDVSDAIGTSDRLEELARQLAALPPEAVAALRALFGSQPREP